MLAHALPIVSYHKLSYNNDGHHLLAAMETLTRLLQSQSVRQAGMEQSLQKLLVLSDGSNTLRPSSQCSFRPTSPAQVQPHSTTFTKTGIGLDSILSWPIFSASGPYVIPLTTRRDDLTAAYTLPGMQLGELLRLEAKFLTNVHPKNPIIDTVSLRGYICHLAEHGPDWSPETCLVALVCALGAYSQAYRPQDDLQGGDSFIPPIDWPSSDSIARGFWAIAVKRLGIVVGQESATAIQCLSLAG